MRRHRRRLSALLLAAFSASAAAGTSFVPMTDAELADRAPLILEGRVLAVEPAAAGTAPAVDYLVQVERPIKGGLAEDTVVVRVPGGVRADGVGWMPLGVPSFDRGEAVLLFLEPRGDGRFGISQLMLGAFHLEARGERLVARRDLAGAHALPRAGTDVGPEGLRDAAAFAAWLEARAEGRRLSASYHLETEPKSDAPSGPRFSSLVSSREPPPLGCGANGGHRLRWFGFELGGRANWFAHFAGQPGLPAGGGGELRRALEAWNEDPHTAILYRYGGLTNAAGGLEVLDERNTFLFDDPNGEIAGSFDGVGVLALGGPWLSCELRQHAGESFHPIVEADVITQDGLESFFAASPDPSRAAAELFAHELGHTLGLGHSDNPEALMFGAVHDDGRGAALDPDDLAGAFSLYGNGPEPALPAAPELLTAQAVSSTEVDLDWLDASSDESAFRIERRREDAGAFSLVTTVTPGTESFRDRGLEPSTAFVYQVRAQSAAGWSAPSNEARVATLDNLVPRAPSSLRATALSDEKVRLAWQDNSDDETAFRIDVLIDGFFVEIPVDVPADTTEVNVRGLAASTVVSFRVRAINAFGSSVPSNVATTTTFVGSLPCSYDDRRLCLSGGRFEVRARFRNQHAGGTLGEATAVPASDVAGLFWFFTPDNVELIVKVLDGRNLNGHFWVFLGSLSDVEYWITVTDTATGHVREYHSLPGEQSSVADTLAFEVAPEPRASPAPPDRRSEPPLVEPPLLEPTTGGTPPAEDGRPKAGGACELRPETLCLLDDRFEVRAAWRDPYRGAEGTAAAVAGSDSSGFFYFFALDNLELVVKVLDGRALNGHFWVYHGGLSTLAYEITVTDTVTGRSRSYQNRAGEIAGDGDPLAFPAP